MVRDMYAHGYPTTGRTMNEDRHTEQQKGRARWSGVEWLGTVAYSHSLTLSTQQCEPDTIINATQHIQQRLRSRSTQHR